MGRGDPGQDITGNLTYFYFRRDVIRTYMRSYNDVQLYSIYYTGGDLPYLLRRTGILCHRVSYGGEHPRTVQGCHTYYGVQGYSTIECPMVWGGHPRTVQGCRTYYGVQGYSVIECSMVGGTSQDSPGMPYLLWRTGILCHRVSYGGGGHPRTVHGCHTYYGVQGYSAKECPMVGGTSQDSPGTSVIHPYTGRVIYEGIVPGHSMD